MADATYELIEKKTLGSYTTNLTFSSIPATYTDLQLVAMINGYGADYGSLEMTINADSSSSSYWNALFGTNATKGQDSTTWTGKINFTHYNPATASRTFAIWNFLNYANTDFYTTILSEHGQTGTNPLCERAVTQWRSTNAITSIKIESYSPSYAPNSTFALYGIL